MADCRREVYHQWGKTYLHLTFLLMAVLHWSESIVRATMWVTILDTGLEYNPPMARTPPMIASESPLGRSAQQTTRPEKNNRGSGLYCRGFASLPLAIEAFTQSGFTTDFKPPLASSYSGKSVVLDMMCVIFCKGTRSTVADFVTSSAPLSASDLAS